MKFRGHRSALHIIWCCIFLLFFIDFGIFRAVRCPDVRGAIITKIVWYPCVSSPASVTWCSVFLLDIMSSSSHILHTMQHCLRKILNAVLGVEFEALCKEEWRLYHTITCYWFKYYYYYTHPTLLYPQSENQTPWILHMGAFGANIKQNSKVFPNIYRINCVMVVFLSWMMPNRGYNNV